MKRLLLLGGLRYLLPVIEAAHRLGYEAITCDYNPNNIAHRYADSYCNIDITDKEAVLKAAETLKVHGIMSFACDPGVVTAAYVAEKLGLPSCGPYESVCILQNKVRFRRFLKEHGFRVPVAKGYTSFAEAFQDRKRFHWPVIVKPADSAGSKGVVRVESAEKLKKSIQYACSFSQCSEFIVEDFLERKGCSSDTDCFSVDGELKFVSFSSQRFDKNAVNPYVPSAYSWPSTFSDKSQKELTAEIQRLLRLLDMKTSLYNIETRECVDGKAYIMELSPRGGGNRLAEILKYATGVDLVTHAVKAAMGDSVTVEQKPYEGNWAEVILHSNEAGVFESLWTSKEISSNIVETDLWLQNGDRVEEFSGANKAIGTLVLRFEDQKKLQEVLENQENYIRIVMKKKL